MRNWKRGWRRLTPEWVGSDKLAVASFWLALGNIAFNGWSLVVLPWSPTGWYILGPMHVFVVGYFVWQLRHQRRRYYRRVMAALADDDPYRPAWILVGTYTPGMALPPGSYHVSGGKVYTQR